MFNFLPHSLHISNILGNSIMKVTSLETHCKSIGSGYIISFIHFIGFIQVFIESFAKVLPLITVCQIVGDSNRCITLDLDCPLWGMYVADS